MSLSGLRKVETVCNSPEWLPNLPECDTGTSEWVALEQESWEVFEWDFLKSNPLLRSLPIKVDRKPIDGKVEGFYHVTSEDNAGDRELNYERCRHLCWIRPVIEHIDDDKFIKAWYMQHGSKMRLYIWFDDRFIVVLSECKDHYFLVTAFPTSSHRVAKHEKDWQCAIKKGDAYYQRHPNSVHNGR